MNNSLKINSNEFNSIAYKIFIIFCILIFLDTIYISFTYNLLFENVLHKINNTKDIKIRYLPTLFFYVIFATGIYFLLIQEKKSLNYSFLFGVFIYLFYELTNYAIIEAWDLKIVILDSLWGGILVFLTVMSANSII